MGRTRVSLKTVVSVVYTSVVLICAVPIIIVLAIIGRMSIHPAHGYKKDKRL